MYADQRSNNHKNLLINILKMNFKKSFISPVHDRSKKTFLRRKISIKEY